MDSQFAESQKLSHPSPSHWEVLDEESVAECRVFEVYREHCRHPVDGRESDFYTIGSRDWVNTLALTPKRELVMVQQYRFGTKELSWEIPGGIIDPGESPLEAGIRELREETGYEGENARILGHCSPNPAILRNRCHFAFIENAHVIHEQEWDENEEISVQTMPLDDVFEMARTMQLSHTLTMNALLYLKLVFPDY